ncbi:MAG: transposase, partial [Terriglobia bacterium]
MALGKRRQKQTSFWVETSQLQARGPHPFYDRLNQILDRAKFDTYVERICRKYYAPTMGRPSIAPGVYFRCFLVGYLEGIDSERGIAYRVSDSLSLREFLGLSLEEQTPDHSTLSKTRRLMNLGTHKAVFRWALKQLAREGLLSGKNLGVDATTLEANAALKSILRRDNGVSYDEHVTQLMQTEGIEEPTPAERQRFDRRRKKSLSNRDWVNPHDREARITKMKDGRTHLAYKAEHAVDLEIGAVVALTVQPADRGDTVSMVTTLAEAGSTVTELAGQAARADAVGPVETVSEVGVERVVADKGYHSKQALEDLAEVGVRTVIAEPERKPQQWAGQSAAQAAVYANRRRLNTQTGKALMRRRGELIERSFAHLYDTGGMRRVHLRGKNNIAKRALIHAAAFNLSLILRQVVRAGTARQAADLLAALCFAFLRLIQAAETALPVIRPRGPLVRPARTRNRCRWWHRQNASLSTG